ncbi:long-chain fatty acid transporter [Cryptococcus gattii E566]|uniref:Long-chain fatty acid transporter, putative n=2 Tax=Cryptococcus gattii TaxID=37769 RepID=E6R487_CRYGW|nr:Long-chain fatty acid transporter, putative [Cryptococcus gattii WM276]ADV21885.1 Long-chain fatty acid transporter, putative [Cryptococcus gattii WM276]KIR80811.1 long-chain fatty acid transporter [Cryptococcus gattii EJB2]KIY35669.1 long-chain fatty acid transporter [Cryptococcus gattii E566]KJE03338.1 long-chain fatty acid transporter [Cryptococcus gattii NT-10]
MDGTVAGLDAQFNRAVDIVQSLPKSGTIQTTYEDKLLLYSLYKQAIEGDVAIPRPGMLDLLGKAKWDAWNRQKGIDKAQAKRLYVSALVKILRKYADAEGVLKYLQILEHETPPIPSCPGSPASSSSSYHSSQASPALFPQSNNLPTVPQHDMLPLDPSLPPPDIGPNFIPPSSFHSPHRSLSSSMQEPKNGALDAVGRTSKDGSLRGQGPSMAQNLASESHAEVLPDRIQGTESKAVSSKPGWIHSPRRQRRDSQASARLASPMPHPTVGSRDFLGTPEAISSPFFALILRRDERRKSWFSWEGQESDELDNFENDHAKELWDRTGVTTVTKFKTKKKSISIRVLWFLLRTLRRALMDVGVGVVVTFIVIMVLNGGWGRTRWMVLKYKERLRRFLTDQ